MAKLSRSGLNDKKLFVDNPFKYLAQGLSSSVEDVWEEEPVDIETFINDKRFLNNAWDEKNQRGCRPKIMEIAKGLSDSNVREGFLLLGKGCITGDALITLADGSVCRMDKLWKRYGNKKTFELLNINQETNECLISKAAIKYSGEDVVYLVELEDGKKIKATKNHEFITIHGKKKLENIKCGESLTVSSDQSIIDGEDLLTAEEARFLGYMVGDGCTYVMDYRRNVLTERFSFTTGDPEIMKDFIYCLKTMDPDCEPTIVDTYAPNKWGIWWGSCDKLRGRKTKAHAPNACRLLMEITKMWGRDSGNKKVPQIIRKSTKKIIGEFLKAYWMCDGECNFKRQNKFYYEISSKSRLLMYGIRDLLLRIGINVKVHKRTKFVKAVNRNYTGFNLGFMDDESCKKFFRYIKLFSHKGKNQLDGLRYHSGFSTAEINFFPEDVRNYYINGVGSVINGKKLNGIKKITISDAHLAEQLIGGKRNHLARCVHYAKIKSIKKLDKKRSVYDITVATNGVQCVANYCANGIYVSNSGKDYVSSILHLYGIYLCECMYSPQNYYGLSPGSAIYFINVARNEEQAKNVFFKEFIGHLHNCAWFEGKYLEPGKQHVEFLKNVVALSGNSQAFSWLGYNTIQWVGDEIAFFLESNSKDEDAKDSKAEECWEAAFGSCKTRFPKHYKMIGITTPRYDDDFVMQKFESLKRRMEEGSGDAYVMQLATWDIHPGLTKEDFKDSLERDFRRTMRDFGAQPMGVITSFWGDPEFIEHNVCESCKACPVYLQRDEHRDAYACWENNECRANAYRGNGEFHDWFVPDYDAEYYMHFDLSKNKDKTAFSMGHVIDWVEVKLNPADLLMHDSTVDLKNLDEDDLHEERPIIKLDFIGWVDPSRGRDTRLTRNREVYYNGILTYVINQLIEKQFNIAKVTFDQFQSHQFKQDIEDRGIETELVSLDRTDEVPVNAKNCFIENRVIYPYVRIFAKEARYLKYIGNKVDHPTGKGKDICDSAFGTVYDCQKEQTGSTHFTVLETSNRD